MVNISFCVLKNWPRGRGSTTFACWDCGFEYRWGM